MKKKLPPGLLLVAALAGCATTPPPPVALDKAAVSEGLKNARRGWASCYDRYQEKGAVVLEITVAPSGEVTAVGSSGKESATTRCVVDATRTARFAKVSGPAKTFFYPVLLR